MKRCKSMVDFESVMIFHSFPSERKLEINHYDNSSSTYTVSVHLADRCVESERERGWRQNNEQWDEVARNSNLQNDTQNS